MLKVNIQDTICTKKNDRKTRKMLLTENFLVTCFICGEPVSLMNCSYLGGDPVHKEHK